MVTIKGATNRFKQDIFATTYYPSSGYEGTKDDYKYYYATLNSSADGTMYSFFIAIDSSIAYLCDYMSDTIIATYNPAA